MPLYEPKVLLVIIKSRAIQEDAKESETKIQQDADSTIAVFIASQVQEVGGILLVRLTHAKAVNLSIFRPRIGFIERRGLTKGKASRETQKNVGVDII